MNSSGANVNPTGKPSFWNGAVMPFIVALISAAFLTGFFSGGLAKDNAPNIQGADRYMRVASAGGHVVIARSQDGGDNSTAGDDAVNDPAGNYAAALDLIKRNYYGGPVDTAKTRLLTYDAIRGLLASLRDQFTSFLDPDEWSQMQATTQGDFEGIGALLQQDGVSVKIVRPIENSPAEHAGVKADDVIVSVNGVSVKGKDINDVVRLIKGPPNTRVTIGVLRGKTPMSFAIVRARVEPPIVQHWMEDNQAKIGHIVLSEFNEKSIDQMNVAFADLERQGMKALVFDLRYNPGGLLETAIDVASVFIPPDSNRTLNNTVVWIHSGSGREEAKRLRPLEHTAPRIPLVVLVNDNSASASEIVTGAIKDYGVGTIMGDRTFGKGRVQTLFPLDDGSALRLTTALYFPPKHYDINFKHDEDGNRIPGTGGIVPNIVVKQSPKWKMEDFKDKTDDTQLQKALIFLRARLKGLSTAQATEMIVSGK